MTHTATQVTDIAALLHDGHIAAAKRQARQVLTDADPHALEVIARCVAILETAPPTVAVPKLRHYWKVCGSDTDRAIIAACAPEQSDTRAATPRPDRAPRHTRYQVPRDIRTQVRPELRRRPDLQQAEARTRADRVAEDYQQQRAGVDDQPAVQDRPDGYILDYDRAALPTLSGTPCVRCWLERPRADHTPSQDDGLCTECRERGRPGIPALPAGHTRAAAIKARCAFIAEQAPPAAAHAILRNEWRRAATADRATITAWVQRHHEVPDTPGDDTPGADTEPAPTEAACQTCGSVRAVRDGACADCARLDSIHLPPTGTTAATPADRADIDAAEAYALAAT